MTIASGRIETKSAQNAARAFVLVHGGFHGGWCYERVAQMLRARGHRVFTPTLTGLGERSHLAHVGADCSLHIQDIVNVIRWERLTDVILCGHSYGGLVIGGVADRMPERMASLVYLDAPVPEDGKSGLDMLSAALQTGLMSLAAANGGSMLPLPPVPSEALGVNEADRAMVDALCTPQPWATLCERLKLTGAYKTVPKKMYIRATASGAPMPYEMYLRVKDEIAQDRTWSYVEIACGHDVMLDAPERLAEALLAAM